MKKRISIVVMAALASLALLIPAGSAGAAFHRVPFCGQLTSSGYQSMTLKPGQVCGFLPVAVSSIWPIWKVVQGGKGSVCVGVVQYPPGWPNGKALTPSGKPLGTEPPRDPYDGRPPHPQDAGYPYSCDPYNLSTGELGYTTWWAFNGFGAVYGQPVLVNFSTATIRTLPNNTSDWGWLNYYA